MKGSIMIVDDDIEIRQLLCTMLRMIGYEICEASDGLDALAKIENCIPDAMVLDVMMPNMDGITLCKALRKATETAVLPIIMLSGKAQQEDIEAGLKAGANRYLAKPMSMNDLVQNLQDVMQ
ncbi:MAG: response regulator [Anaerolineales bacterium]|nr:response regulator [Anaerolineales bacterium]